MRTDSRLNQSSTSTQIEVSEAEPQPIGTHDAMRGVADSGSYFVTGGSWKAVKRCGYRNAAISVIWFASMCRTWRAVAR